MYTIKSYWFKAYVLMNMYAFPIWYFHDFILVSGVIAVFNRAMVLNIYVANWKYMLLALLQIVYFFCLFLRGFLYSFILFSESYVFCIVCDMNFLMGEKHGMYTIYKISCIISISLFVTRWHIYNHIQCPTSAVCRSWYNRGRQ